MCLADALGGKLLHVLIDFCGQSAKFIHAHISPGQRWSFDQLRRSVEWWGSSDAFD